ncbi:MAG: UDP-glucose dehydrogenase family protein [Terriglobales bacterium]
MEDSYRVSVFGMGYVGSVTAACFAKLGHAVIGVDTDAAKVGMIGAGQPPLIEPELSELIAEGSRSGRLCATTDAGEAVAATQISFVCVGTPSLRGGKLDLAHVEHVCTEIGRSLARKRAPHLVVLRSTMLPGSTRAVAQPALERGSGGRAGVDFSLAYHPEFMREATAVRDFFDPPYTVLGADDSSHLEPLRRLYSTHNAPVLTMGLAEAEMVKYMSNVFHAVKIGFANEMGTLAKHLGVDTEVVTAAFLSDTKLNVSRCYLEPGFAFGGSCLPKDLRAVQHRAKELNLKLPMLEAVLASNEEHLRRAAELILSTGKKRIAMLGLSFKTGTDDLRESPQVQLVKRLLGEGCSMRIWDDQVLLSRVMGANRAYIEREIPHIGLLLADDLEETLAGAELVVIATTAASTRNLARFLRPDHLVVDLVHLEAQRRQGGQAAYQGICW